MTDISQQLGQVHQRLDVHDGRIDAQDGRITKLETHTAVEAVRSEHIQKSLNKIDDNITWVLRLVVGALILAVIGFAMGGGFHVGS